MPRTPPTAPPTVAPVEGPPEPDLPELAESETQTRLAQVWQDCEICWHTCPLGQDGQGPIGSGQLMHPLLDMLSQLCGEGRDQL